MFSAVHGEKGGGLCVFVGGRGRRLSSGRAAAPMGGLGARGRGERTAQLRVGP